MNRFNSGSAIRSDAEHSPSLSRTGMGIQYSEAITDRLTLLVHKLLNVPMVLVAVDQSNRQFLNGWVGAREPSVTMREIHQPQSFREFAFEHQAGFIVDDVFASSIVFERASVIDLGIVTYAGVPLITEQGQVLGALCVADQYPRVWTEGDISLLREFAHSVLSEMEYRSARAAEGQEQRAEIEARWRKTAERISWRLNHEVNNAVGSILLSSDLLERVLHDPSQGRQYLEVIRSQAWRIAGVLSLLEDFTRLSGEKTSPTLGTAA